MKYLNRSLTYILFALCAHTAIAQDLQSIINEAPNQEALWSVTVRDDQGRILESLNAEKVIQPASNQKLVTTAAVLDHFGADFRYKTYLYGDGELKGTLWNGNIVFKGSGDPSISGDMYDGDRYHVFKEFADQLKEQGIEKIGGMLLADISLFDEQTYPKGWDWYDFSFYYGVQISPLSFNNNAVDLEVFAEGEVGERPRIEWFPSETKYVDFKNEQIITPADQEYDEYYRRELGGNQILLKSTLPKGYYEEESLSIHKPAMYFLDSFKTYLRRNGIDFNLPAMGYGHTFDYDTSRVLAIHESEPLSRLIEWANKESDNFYTEMMLKILSADIGTSPGSFEHGIEQVRIYLADLGIDTAHVQMNDGSGMAAGNFSTTGILSDLLVKLKGQTYFEAYYKSMSVAGIDGTLAYRMKDTPLYQNFRGKSGFLTGVRTLSGYFKAKSGKPLTISLATNNFISEKVRPIDAVHEQILMYLYEKY